MYDESRGRLKMATDQRARTPSRFLGQRAVSAMLSSLIEYLQNGGRNMNLAFVTEWQTLWKYNEPGNF